jgi:tetratricopeptide (TPR) repeat protein
LGKRAFLILSIAVIALACLVIYSNSFNSSFHFDDYDNIANVVAIRSLANIGQILSLTQRPLVDYTFAVNYFFNKYNVFGYHLFNLLVHILCGILVFIFIKLTLNLPGLKDRYASSWRWMAFFGALIFVCHPVKVEAVTYITARSESLASLFYLSGLVFFILSVIRPPRNRRYEILAVLSSLLGMASKQIVVTLPFTVLLYDYIFLSQMRLSSLRKRLRFHFMMFSTVLLLIFLIMKVGSGPTSGFGNPNLPTAWQYLCTEFRALIYYLKLLFLPLPANLNFDTYFPVSKTFFEPRVIISFLACAALAICGIWNLKKNPLAAFFIFWYFIILAPTSSILPIEDVMYERRLYLASLGWIMLVLLAMRNIKPRARFTILTLAVIALCAWTFQRNFAWKDELTLWQDTMKKAPLKPRNQVNFGFLWLKLGRIDRAQQHMEEALRLDPDCANAHLDLGLIYSLRGNYDGAVTKFKEVIRRWPGYAAAHSNLGTAYRKKGMLEDAEREFKIALRLVPDFGEARANLALVYAQKGNYKKAVEELKAASRMNPDIPEPHMNLGVIYQKFGQDQMAIDEFKQAIALNPYYPLAHYNLAISYVRLGLKEEAEKELETLGRLDPRLADKLRQAPVSLAGDKGAAGAK